MRLHRLRLRAFGPFAGTEEVDFDALTAQGLFLLHGPTGSGKTSVLDAVCFALYGRVPGSRGALATPLHSHHAEAGAPPEVSCELTVAGRRLEVTRSPAWQRPKKRGGGTTPEQARVLVKELVANPDGSAWVTRATRIDEAALLVEDAVGLTADQFTKLVLLPQGEFAAFLAADADTRRKLLERLFDTDRFSAVQTWLNEHRAALRRQVEDVRAGTRELVARAEQVAAGAGIPVEDTPGGSEEDLDATAVQRVGALQRQLTDAWNEASARLAASTTEVQQARERHAALTRLAEQQARHAKLRLRLDQLEGAGPEQDVARTRLAAAARAAGLEPLSVRLEQGRGQHARATAALEAAVAKAARTAQDAGLPFDPGALDDLLRRVHEQQGQLKAAEHDDEQLRVLAAGRDRLARELTRASRLLAEAQGRAANLDEQLTSVTDRVGQATGLAQSLPALREVETAAREAAAAVLEREQLSQLVDRLTADRDAARARFHDHRQDWLDLRERRLNGMAAELAARLVADEPCAVCGALYHPKPAAPEERPVTDADELAARRATEAAETELNTVAAALAEQAGALASAQRVAGQLTAAEASVRLQEATGHREVAEDAQEALTVLTGEQARLTAEAAEAAQVVQAVGQTVAELTARLAQEQAVVADLEARVVQARGGHDSLRGRAEQLVAAVDALTALGAARHTEVAVRQRLDELTATAQSLAAEAGFEDLPAALAAVLPGAVRKVGEDRLRRYDDELAAVRDQLQDPALAAAAQQPAADLAASAAALELAGDAAARQARTATLCESGAAALGELNTRLAAHLAAARPLLDRFATADELARCAEGTGGDNTLRMSLAAYVIAARLEEVAAAASVRLAAMSDGRYTLEHHDEVERGRGRSGLGLRVLDGWTGRYRLPASLSGGETFYTSLALALGLADVVAAEAGGVTLETLFVDEGFGTLDEEALEDVMGVLDELRSGGRVVGLVSHVDDLRQRIPSRLEVRKTRSGSRLRATGAA